MAASFMSPASISQFQVQSSFSQTDGCQIDGCQIEASRENTHLLGQIEKVYCFRPSQVIDAGHVYNMQALCRQPLQRHYIKQ